jgi:hypothetical protein
LQLLPDGPMEPGARRVRRRWLCMSRCGGRCGGAPARRLRRSYGMFKSRCGELCSNVGRLVRG